MIWCIWCNECAPAESRRKAAETGHCSSITTFSHICNTRALSSHRSAVMMETSLARFLTLVYAHLLKVSLLELKEQQSTGYTHITFAWKLAFFLKQRWFIKARGQVYRNAFHIKSLMLVGVTGDEHVFLKPNPSMTVFQLFRVIGIVLRFLHWFSCSLGSGGELHLPEQVKISRKSSLKVHN